jgi:two-component system response regulator HydG
VLAATHRDLDALAEVGHFRRDLLFRLDVVRIDVPALRARGNDILLLAQSFVLAEAGRSGKHVTGISAPAAARLLAYPWPGNVRELGNAIERAVALTDYEQITVEDLPPKIQGFRRSHVIVDADDPADFVSLDEVERRYILRVLEAVGGNRTRAAQVLGVDRKTLYRKLQEYRLP